MRALPDPPLMLITGEVTGLEDLLARARAAIDGGVRWIQIRGVQRTGADLPARVLYEAARQLAAAGVTVVVHDRADIARACSADGLHLPGKGLSLRDARGMVGGALLGASVHSPAAIAEWTGTDYVQLGPIYETASKRRYGPPLGLGVLTEAAAVSVAGMSPAIIAVGGITIARLEELASAGADGVAIIGSIWDAPDTAVAAAEAVARARTCFEKRRVRSSS